LTSKGKIVAVTTALSIALGLTVVPLASAYNVPVPVGLPGGQPTPPKGGTSVSKSVTKAAAVSLAGYTGLELALRTPTVNFKFPSAGSVSCSVSVNKSKFGSGSASKGSKGYKTFNINLTDSGRTYLYDHNGQAIPLSVTCAFAPEHGKKSTSTSTVVLDA
jgi:hypothetical protein